MGWNDFWKKRMQKEMSSFHSNSRWCSIDLKGTDGDKSGDNVFFMCTLCINETCHDMCVQDTEIRLLSLLSDTHLSPFHTFSHRYEKVVEGRDVPLDETVKRLSTENLDSTEAWLVPLHHSSSFQALHKSHVSGDIWFTRVLFPVQLMEDWMYHWTGIMQRLVCAKVPNT